MPFLGLGVQLGHSPPPSGGGGLSNTYSVDFDGVDDYLSLGDLSSLVGGQNDVSYSIWINYSSTGNQGLLGNTAATGEAYIFSGNFYTTQLHDSTFANLGSLSLNTWYHIVCSRTTTNTTFYKNGSVASTNNHSATATLSTLFNSDLRVGVAPRLGWYSNVKVDEFALFTSALSASDVTAIYNSGVPADLTSYSPVGWWRMGDNDSGTGTTITDQGSGGNDGTLTNGPTFHDLSTAPDSIYVAGGGGGGGAGAFSNTYSLEFDGVDDHLDTNSNFQSTFNSGFSFSLWGKVSAIGANQGLLGGENSNYYDRFVCFVNTVGQINFYYTSDNQGVPTIKDTSGTSLTDWFHVVGTVVQNGSNVDLTLYVNGSQKATGSATSTMANFGATTTPVDLFFGGRNYNGALQLPLNGLIDEAAIFNTVLSASDITSIYNSGVPGDITSLSPVGYWRMGDNDSGTGTTITDQGSGGNNGTLTNGPTFSTDVPS